jgi:hypothetical protein
MANKWITRLVDRHSPERRLAKDLAAQRRRWAVRKTADGRMRFEQVVTKGEAKREVQKALRKMSAAARLELAKRLIDEHEAEELRKSESDPTTRVGQLAARGIDGADVHSLGRNEKAAPLASPSIEVDHGDGDVRPLGRGRQAAGPVKNTERVLFDSVLRQPAWTGTHYE